VIKMKAEKPLVVVKKIEVKNTCFYEYDSSFENRIVFNELGVYKSSYRLNQKHYKLNIK